MTTHVTENPLNSEIASLIESCVQTAAAMLGLEPSSSPDKLVDAVDTMTYQLQKGSGPALSADENPLYLLGSLWGQQLVRGLGWHWAELTFHEQDDAKATGVFSPDGSLAIYPFYFIEECLESHRPITILLAYNMLVDGSDIPDLPARQYEDVMDNVHHIVPRD